MNINSLYVHVHWQCSCNNKVAKLFNRCCPSNHKLSSRRNMTILVKIISPIKRTSFLQGHWTRESPKEIPSEVLPQGWVHKVSKKIISFDITEFQWLTKKTLYWIFQWALGLFFLLYSKYLDQYHQLDELIFFLHYFD